MTKFYLLQNRRMDEIPEHVLEELKAKIDQIIAALNPVCEHAHPSLVLSAMNHVYAMMIDMYVSDDIEEKKKATLISAKSLISNVEFYARIPIFEQEEN